MHGKKTPQQILAMALSILCVLGTFTFATTIYALEMAGPEEAGGFGEFAEEDWLFESAGDVFSLHGSRLEVKFHFAYLDPGRDTLTRPPKTLFDKNG